MPYISTRAIQVPASPIRKLVPFADKAKQKGIKVLHLNIGQPDLPTSPNFMEAIRNATLDVLEYSHSAGNESYRKKLTQYYSKFSINLTSDDILITTGGSEALLFAFLTCLNPGDEIIIPEPFYANYNSFAITAGVTVIPITTTIENNFALPKAEEFKKLITPKTKAILINNPANPAGNIYSPAELNALKDLIRQHDLYLIADEVYKEFAYDGQVFKSVLTLEGIEQNCLMVDSVSKRYSACGARIGCLVSKNKDVIAAALKFAQARLSPPTLEQIGAEAAVDTPDSYFTDCITEYKARRDLLFSELAKIPGVVCPMPTGAFYGIIRLPIDDSDKFAQWLLESFSYKNTTVMVAPATGFYATPGLGKSEVRIAYVLKLEDIKMAVECLAEALKQYPGKTN